MTKNHNPEEARSKSAGCAQQPRAEWGAASGCDSSRGGKGSALYVLLNIGSNLKRSANGLRDRLITTVLVLV